MPPQSGRAEIAIFQYPQVDRRFVRGQLPDNEQHKAQEGDDGKILIKCDANQSFWSPFSSMIWRAPSPTAMRKRPREVYLALLPTR